MRNNGYDSKYNSGTRAHTARRRNGMDNNLCCCTPSLHTTFTCTAPPASDCPSALPISSPGRILLGRKTRGRLPLPLCGTCAPGGRPLLECRRCCPTDLCLGQLPLLHTLLPLVPLLHISGKDLWWLTRCHCLWIANHVHRALPQRRRRRALRRALRASRLIFAPHAAACALRRINVCTLPSTQVTHVLRSI